MENIQKRMKLEQIQSDKEDEFEDVNDDQYFKGMSYKFGNNIKKGINKNDFSFNELNIQPHKSKK